MTILDTIVASKKEVVGLAKRNTPLHTFQEMEYFHRETVSLRKRLIDGSGTGIIAEFKRRSPSKGVINDRASLPQVIRAYSCDADAISVLTDFEFFGGSLQDLLNARRSTDLPLLRKDFMIDPYQVMEAKAFGADVILLIAACLTPAQVSELAAQAKEIGLEVLLEIHNQEELGHLSPSVDMVGVNNRNLKNFQVDLQHSMQLIREIPERVPAIAESGISDPATIVSLRQAGFKGFLIGENFMKAQEPSIAFADFVENLKAKNEN